MSFEVLAPIYRLMERVLAGSKLHLCRCVFLERIPTPKKILILGEGPGRFVVECVRRFPNAAITCMEESAGMISQAKANLAHCGLPSDKVTFIQADILKSPPPNGAFDLIVTHFFLDCFQPEQLEALVPSIAQAGTKDSHWLLADFQEAASGWKRWRSRCILASMYAFFRVVTRLPATSLTPPDLHLMRAGFILRERVETEWGLLKSDWWVRPNAG
ncbi:methyltransferase family protein [Roseimicrobium gellanilyticum]|uniref:Methyltransferase family protein n=1 Tax=Roseimicrobium gellanilyticum TaxID=748857 RepID=A0A366HNT6_9BACT|nr:class I SAM-dependent methyltransferase [Roseimicrobium gellanilyticum]RBP44446.1 methyltransferase family protein [Roseimicrobium gellanilyticum]